MLEEAFPSSPARPPVYTLNVRRRDPLGDKEMFGIGFCTLYGARKYLEVLLDEDDFVQETDTFLRTETGIEVRCSDLRALIDYEYKGQENYWELPEPHVTEALWFRRARDAPPAEHTGKSKREKRLERKAKRVPGMLSIGELAEQLGMTPRDARAILRKAKVEKPASGWAWLPDAADKIRALLQENK